MTFLRYNSGSTFQEQIKPGIDILSPTYTPYLNKYKTMVGSMGSRLIWFNESLSDNIVKLDTAYTAGSGSVTLQATTTLNPYKITEGVTHLETRDGAAVYKVVTWNSSTRVATITLEFGSDSSLADETELYISQYGEYGEDFGSGDGDELAFSSTDINYPTFVYHRLKSADGNEEGKFQNIGTDEAVMSWHERKKFIQNVKQLERNAFYSVKAAGNSAATRQGNTISAGLKSKSGGLAQTISSGGGQVTDWSSGTPISEDLIISNVEYIRSTGALTELMSTERGENNMGEIDLYCAEETLSDINEFIKLERDDKALSAQTNGQFGSWATRLIANGAYVNVKVTSGCKRRDVFMLPANAQIEVPFIYFFDEVMIGKTGHNQKKMFVSAFNHEIHNAYAMTHDKNLANL